MQECSLEAKGEGGRKAGMLGAKEIAFVLTRSAACDVVDLRIEGFLPKTS